MRVKEVHSGGHSGVTVPPGGGSANIVTLEVSE
jgi:hypothetical protein